MRIFLSYRRADNAFLAFDLYRRLSEANFTVFLDVASLAPGEEFPQATHDEINRSDVVIAMIGPAWAPDRLFMECDFVRIELVTAHARGKRVIPVLHSDAQPPQTLNLPAELSWLPHLNMVRFAGPVHLEADVKALVRQLRASVPMLEDLRKLAWRQYETSDHEGLIRTVEEAWREHADRPSPALADCCRTAALSLSRSGQLTGARDLWLARALSTAFLATAPHAFAASLLPFFFRLLGDGYLDEAREVLQEISRLIQERDPGQLPPVRLMRRLVIEKTGYLRYLQGDHAGALGEYQTALNYASQSDDARGELKLRGAIALCQGRLGNGAQARELLGLVSTESAQQGFADVAATAKANLIALESGDEFTPFEVI